MSRVLSNVSKFFAVIEARPYDAYQVLFAVLFVGLWRLAMETIFGSERLGFEGVVAFPVFYLHWFYYFVTVAALLTGQQWRRPANLVLYGILLGVLPPLIDTLVYGPGNFQYAPKYFGEFELTLWAKGFPLGESVTLWLAILGIGFYVFVRTRSAGWTLAALLLGYLQFVFVIYALFPALEAFMSRLGNNTPLSRHGALTVGLLTIAYVNYVALNGLRMRKSISRVGHALPWVAVVFLGARLKGAFTPLTWMVALVVLIVHQSAIFANDYYDREADELEGRVNAVDADDVIILQTISIWLGLAVLLIVPVIGVLVLLYVIATAAYHHRAVRLKNICPINYKTEGLVGAFALAIGITSVTATRLGNADLFALFLAFGGFSLVSMLKDYKDVRSDRAFSVRTIYLILTERGWPLAKVHTLVTAVVTVCLVIPVIWLLAVGTSVFALAVFVVAFVLPIPIVMLRASPKVAVETAIWLMTAYLFVLGRLAPSGVLAAGS